MRVKKLFGVNKVTLYSKIKLVISVFLIFLNLYFSMKYTISYLHTLSHEVWVNYSY